MELARPDIGFPVDSLREIRAKAHFTVTLKWKLCHQISVNQYKNTSVMFELLMLWQFYAHNLLLCNRQTNFILRPLSCSNTFSTLFMIETKRYCFHTNSYICTIYTRKDSSCYFMCSILKIVTYFFQSIYFTVKQTFFWLNSIYLYI